MFVGDTTEACVPSTAIYRCTPRQKLVDDRDGCRRIESRDVCRVHKRAGMFARVLAYGERDNQKSVRPNHYAILDTQLLTHAASLPRPRRCLLCDRSPLAQLCVGRADGRPLPFYVGLIV
jgi:hypothetical protein